ncbi:MAG: hypothetical protein LBF64_05080, partial [Oscillospiraceae bacterium]|nr:hypothetical protein [Oscillospiraceae bacterium]
WKLGSIDRGALFKDMIKKTYEGPGVVTAQGTQTPYAYDENTNTFYHCVSINTFSDTYNRAGGFNAAPAGNTAKQGLDRGLEKINGAAQFAMEGGAVKTIDQSRHKNVECLVVIPEDAPPEVETALLQNLTAKAQNYNSGAGGVTISYRIARGGGNAKPDETPAETPAQDAA